ncbi:MAG: Photosystem I assembly protein Ycf3 [Anaerolineales bacterium]|nr:Photosystem I assembly protein Ycf3 [Anaerolineales bacterium]
MAELGKKLGKLSLAILENFVEGVLGKKFVDELRQPTDKVRAIETALENSEKRLPKEFSPDRAFTEKMFSQVNDDGLGSISDAIEKFYDHPTDPDFQNVINQIVAKSFPDVETSKVSSAVEMYVNILTEEFALADERFKENVRALADLRSVNILRNVEKILSQRGATKVENVTFRSLNQLSPPPADFTGRGELIEQLVADFQRGGGATIHSSKIGGLTGMGGIGKTALGLVVAHKIAKDFPNAQIFLDLKGTTTPLSALEIARHVILSFEPTADLRALDENNFHATYQSVLHGKKALLFFDNARSAEQIAPLRPPETCAMLVTSRWTFSVPGLQPRRVDVMSEADAMKFILELCPRVGDNAASLAKACAYLPLALRIAGSFLQVNGDWSVEKYISQLNDRKKRLETLKQSKENAELTTEPDLLATFELSYNSLKEEDQKRWRVLGVFPASFDATAASAVWDLDDDATRNSLALFRRYSLLDFDENASRYSLHDLLADYTLEQMNAEEEQEARLKHAAHYKDVMSAANALYLEGGEKVLHGLKLFDREWDHIRIAQAWIAENIETSDDLAELVMLYPDASAYCLDLRLTPQQRIQWLKSALDAAYKLDRKDAIGAHLGNLGNAYASLGDARKAIEFYEQRMIIAREIGDRRGEGNALNNMGLAYADLGDARKAIEFYEQALLIDREIGDRRGEGADLGNLGIAYKNLGDARKAIEFYEQYLSIAREIGDRRGEGKALNNLGLAYAALGDARKAIEFHEPALLIDREIGDRRGEGNALNNLGLAYAALGDVRKAIEFYEKKLVIVHQIGDLRGEASALGNLGNAFATLGEKAKAIEFVRQALAIFEAIESPYAEQARNTLKKWGALE